MAGETTLSVRVQPRSPRDEIVGRLDDGRVKIRVAAPPVDGRANVRLIRFLDFSRFSGILVGFFDLSYIIIIFF